MEQPPADGDLLEPTSTNGDTMELPSTNGEMTGSFGVVDDAVGIGVGDFAEPGVFKANEEVDATIGVENDVVASPVHGDEEVDAYLDVAGARRGSTFCPMTRTCFTSGPNARQIARKACKLMGGGGGGEEAKVPARFLSAAAAVSGIAL